MKAKYIILLLLILSGCASMMIPPFNGAEIVKKYTPKEFEEAIHEEKISYMTSRIQELRKNDGIHTFAFRLYPKLSEWNSIKDEIKEGDEVWEYKHKELPNLAYDGPSEYLRHVYLIVRDGRVLKKFEVTTETMQYDL